MSTRENRLDEAAAFDALSVLVSAAGTGSIAPEVLARSQRALDQLAEALMERLPLPAFRESVVRLESFGYGEASITFEPDRWCRVDLGGTAIDMRVEHLRQLDDLARLMADPAVRTAIELRIRPSRPERDS